MNSVRRSPRGSRGPWIAAALALGCGGSPTNASDPPEREPAPRSAPAALLARVDLGPQHRGLSGLTRAGDRLWAVPERTRSLLSFDLDGKHQIEVPIRGLDPDVDLESITSLGGARFAVGTEGRDDGRPSDAILVLEVAGGEARPIDRLELAYDRLGYTAVGNQGIEGLCAAGGVWLAAFETPGVRDGQRVAHLARVDAGDRSWRPLSVRLTSDTGKISALDCRRGDGRLEVIAVERHFEVVRILAFAVADDATDAVPITPRVAADLTALRDKTDNPEGVVALSPDTALLILDNHYGSVLTASELLRIGLVTAP